ncbi:MAG: YggS family pyridoxal phosphate-dependent enzyme [Streptococcaceae bacterium]|jgi:pyridoxal phosphate enzyme (YggS family)|nr:YggS family pyridoxal phosphate-dependent enzyme [Streptococcaceae bacterium]
MTLAENIVQVKASVEEACEKAHRDSSSVKVLAVTKYSDSATTRDFVAAGMHELAENRSDVFLEKEAALADLPEIVWHYIGSLQTRKVRDVIDKVDVFHALDSVKLAHEIEKRATKSVQCFLEVNVSGEASKHGFTEDEAREVIEEIADLSKIRLIGLMTMAPIDATENELHDIFGRTRRLRDELLLKVPTLTELSMGMSQDYEVAIEEGATVVRIGHAFLN